MALYIWLFYLSTVAICGSFGILLWPYSYLFFVAIFSYLFLFVISFLIRNNYLLEVKLLSLILASDRSLNCRIKISLIIATGNCVIIVCRLLRLRKNDYTTCRCRIFYCDYLLIASLHRTPIQSHLKQLCSLAFYQTLNV